MGAALGGGGLLLLLLLAMSGGGSSSGGGSGGGSGDGTLPPPPPSGDDADLADISDADLVPMICEMLAKSVPATTTDRDLARTMLAGAFVGYVWQLVPPNSERSRLLARATELIKRYRSGELSCDLPIQIDIVPKAGGYYQIRYGDTPLGIIGKAYPWTNAAQRIELVKAVTNAPANGGGIIGQGIIVATTQQGNINLIGPTIFSMFKKWRCSPKTSPQRFEPGSCYAVVFLPLIESA